IGKRLAKDGVKQDALPLGTDRELDLIVAGLGADIEPPATDERIAGEQREVQQQLDRALGQFAVADDPAELDPPLRAEHTLQRGLSLMRVDGFAETTRGAEC